jgi:cellulose synthase/poly-beta-1,6-N-acetylglucosamine synthase-like glycosyltransferase
MTIVFFFTLFVFLFPFIGYLRRPDHPTEYQVTHTVAVIAAHNEQRVIDHIITDCEAAHFSEIVVVADRCTDETATIAASHGARVIFVDCGSKTKAHNQAIPQVVLHQDNSAVIMFFDADNRINPDFLERILPYFQDHDMVQCRVRNLNTNTWVARMYLIMAGSWVRFQDALTVLHRSNILCGTGWGAHAATLKKWPQDCHTLTDDLEFTGITRARIYFARDVDTFDEKPATFGVSVKQRTRWVRGAWQVIFTRTRDFDPAKWYVEALPILTAWFTFRFFSSLIHAAGAAMGLLAWVLTITMSSVIDMIYYAMLMDRRDLARLSIWDLLSYTAWCLTNYPIVVYGLITWHVSTWYRTPHVGKVEK